MGERRDLSPPKDRGRATGLFLQYCHAIHDLIDGQENIVKADVAVAPSAGIHPAQPALFTQHPVLSVVIISVAEMLATLGMTMAARAIFPQLQPEFVVLIGLSVLVALTLTLLRWWKVSGFNPPAAWREVHLVLIPLLIVLGLPFLRGVKTSDWGTFFYLLVGYVLTGFMEEGLMRGVVLRVLGPLGVRRSVLISSALFALLHLTNVLFRNPFIVLAQMVGAFVHGIGLSAIRLRTNTIWFVVILHALHDLCLQYANFPSIPLDVVQVTLMMIYGVYLLRT
jgi:membrane protease YdiL (CAAX protease family)